MDTWVVGRDAVEPESVEEPMAASDGGAPQPGLRVGPTSEFSLFFRVKDGQAPSLRAALLELQDTPGLPAW